jgi:hypothetical protein
VLYSLYSSPAVWNPKLFFFFLQYVVYLISDCSEPLPIIRIIGFNCPFLCKISFIYFLFSIIAKPGGIFLIWYFLTGAISSNIPVIFSLNKVTAMSRSLQLYNSHQEIFLTAFINSAGLKFFLRTFLYISLIPHNTFGISGCHYYSVV